MLPQVQGAGWQKIMGVGEEGRGRKEGRRKEGGGRKEEGQEETRNDRAGCTQALVVHASSGQALARDLSCLVSEQSFCFRLARVEVCGKKPVSEVREADLEFLSFSRGVFLLYHTVWNWYKCEGATLLID